MAKPKYPDHAGRMPGHPRYGNPSDPNEESARIAGAIKNLDDWAARNGGSFSGGVSMQYSSGKKYEVPIGDRQIAQKVVSRPLPPKEEVKALQPQATTGYVGTFPYLAEFGPIENLPPCDSPSLPSGESKPSVTLASRGGEAKRSWLHRLFNFIFGE